jgi:putative hydrolase of the HAD superfamily
MPMAKVKAIVFDFDGTILDTETAWYEAFRELYAAHGVELPLSQYSQCIGTSLHLFNPYEYLITDLGMKLDRDKFREAVHVRHAELMEHESVRPGIEAYLRQAREAGIRIGLASSSSMEWVSRHLDRLGLTDYFECIRVADHVEKVKPDPALYVQAVSMLNVKPDEALAIEDSPNGAKAAIAAGLHCVVVTNRITAHLPFGTIQRHASGLDDIAFADLVHDPAALLSELAFSGQ